MLCWPSIFLLVLQQAQQDRLLNIGFEFFIERLPEIDPFRIDFK